MLPVGISTCLGPPGASMPLCLGLKCDLAKLGTPVSVTMSKVSKNKAYLMPIARIGKGNARHSGKTYEDP